MRIRANESAQWPRRQRRLDLLAKLASSLQDAIERVQSGPVAPAFDAAELRRHTSSFDFEKPDEIETVVERVIALLEVGTVHTMHPGYFGLFNPSVAFPGVLADSITAHFNPQLAVWSHAPAAIEMERRAIEALGQLVGWPPTEIAGHMTSGGSEANHTALSSALTRSHPAYAEEGTSALRGAPRLYASAESHLAWLKIAHQVGIGRNAVRLVATDGRGRLDPGALRRSVRGDLARGHLPVFVAATAGTTNAGMIDPLRDCHALCREHKLWFHVDAAWGGAALLSPTAARHLDGIDLADSVTLDAHKWFAVPMGCGVFLCREGQVLADTFRVAADYMPHETQGRTDPYTHSMQWSRRFMGLKLFLSLACMGLAGYRAHIEHALAMGALLQKRLREDGWRVVNDSPVAVVCFVDDLEEADSAAIRRAVVESGKSWISTARFEGQEVLRACVTSHFTRERHVEELVEELNCARAKLTSHS